MNEENANGLVQSGLSSPSNALHGRRASLSRSPSRSHSSSRIHSRREQEGRVGGSAGEGGEAGENGENGGEGRKLGHGQRQSGTPSPPRRTHENGSDLHRRHYSHGDEEPVENPGTTVYVANLSYRIKEEDLAHNFKPFGTIERAQLITEPLTGESRGFGFITYSEKQEAEDAVRSMNGAELGGRSIRTEIAKRAVPRPKTPGKYLGPGSRSNGGRYNQYREGGSSGFTHGHGSANHYTESYREGSGMISYRDRGDRFDRTERFDRGDRFDRFDRGEREREREPYHTGHTHSHTHSHIRSRSRSRGRSAVGPSSVALERSGGPMERTSAGVAGGAERELAKAYREERSYRREGRYDPPYERKERERDGGYRGGGGYRRSRSPRR